MNRITIHELGGPDVLWLIDVPVRDLGPHDGLASARAIGVGRPDVGVRTCTNPWQHLVLTLGIEMQ